ncbi:unnamed protein product [Brassica oleracea var. botrytis]|uniref:(rape) hypothetical protein n=1 Tax=Brassica napus TaxID=3708 RepID=A0A816L1S2_BRANA|nr:unnamed protein product [Brassica napus]
MLRNGRYQGVDFSEQLLNHTTKQATTSGAKDSRISCRYKKRR